MRIAVRLDAPFQPARRAVGGAGLQANEPHRGAGIEEARAFRRPTSPPPTTTASRFRMFRNSGYIVIRVLRVEGMIYRILPYFAECATRRARTLCGKSVSCRKFPPESIGMGCNCPVDWRCLLDVKSASTGFVTQISPTSSVFGMIAIRIAARSGCQQVASPVSTHSRSVAKAIGTLERCRKHAVIVLACEISGSIAATSRRVVRSARPIPVPLP